MTTQRRTLLYEQTDLPVFQNRMYDTEQSAKACPKGDLRLVQDEVTGLVYNAAFRPDLMVYDHHYQNEQAVSSRFRAHLDEVAAIVERRLGRDAIVEIGCGKGYFLEVLARRGVDIRGFDPTYEGDSPRVRRSVFESGAGAPAKGFILRHVLEHIQHPYDFLRDLAAPGGGPLIYIEVPSFEWICEQRAWFDVFYEHVNYFRLSDFDRMFATVVESGRLFGGQYLYAVAELATLRRPVRAHDDRVTLPGDFMDSLHARPEKDGPIAIWGGASKGAIFALLKTRQGAAVTTVIDINPAKQGKYLPATGLLVQSPSTALACLPRGSAIYVMNSNYLDEIRQVAGDAYTYVMVDHG